MEFAGSRKVKRPLPARVVLVRPEYSMNVGMVARVVKNFGVTDLAFVEPKCAIDFEAYKFAKHSKEILDEAKSFDSLEKATSGFDLVIGTTGVINRFTGNLKNCVSLPELNPLVAGKRVAIVFGSEGNGLSQSDLAACDVLATIPADPAHPILNLSHSVAVVLYSLFYSRHVKPKYAAAEKKEIDALTYLFSQLVDEAVKSKSELHDPQKAKLAFKRVIGRANIAATEAQTLMAVLSRTAKKLKLSK